MTILNFKRSQRVKEILIHEGFLYNLDKFLEVGERWRCRSKKCCGKIFLDAQRNTFRETLHNHLPDYQNYSKIEAISEIKERSVETRETPKIIVTTVTQNVEEAIIPLLPNYKSLSNSVTKFRNRCLMNFITTNEEIPETLKKNLRGKIFFVSDSGINDEERYVIFQRDFMLDFLNKSKIWLIDGTFKSVPSRNTQVVSIHSHIF
ncbi:hypothetical protein DMUE_0181 [Dictyocoela muelleri]|nr:hypothetical protein DMUE_0181 [Dictyocoela muelleri]